METKKHPFRDASNFYVIVKSQLQYRDQHIL